MTTQNPAQGGSCGQSHLNMTWQHSNNSALGCCRCRNSLRHVQLHFPNSLSHQSRRHIPRMSVIGSRISYNNVILSCQPCSTIKPFNPITPPKYLTFCILSIFPKLKTVMYQCPIPSFRFTEIQRRRHSYEFCFNQLCTKKIIHSIL